MWSRVQYCGSVISSAVLLSMLPEAVQDTPNSVPRLKAFDVLAVLQISGTTCRQGSY
jgi:hypothetical protein